MASDPPARGKAFGELGRVLGRGGGLDCAEGGGLSTRTSRAWDGGVGLGAREPVCAHVCVVEAGAPPQCVQGVWLGFLWLWGAVLSCSLNSVGSFYKLF